MSKSRKGRGLTSAIAIGAALARIGEEDGYASRRDIERALSPIVDKVLNYHPKPKSKQQKKRKRKRGKLLARQGRKTE
jgi:hypothetical protein